MGKCESVPIQQEAEVADIEAEVTDVVREPSPNFIRKFGELIPYTSRDDREFVLHVVKREGLALYFASENLRGDRKVVLAAVQENGNALEFAAESLRDDREIVLTAIICCEYKVSSQWVIGAHDALKFALESLRSDPEILMTAAEVRPYHMRDASIKTQCSTLVAIVKHHPEAYLSLPEKLRKQFPGLATVAEGALRLRGLEDVRQDEVFEGRVSKKEGDLCIVSFPGAYYRYWAQLVKSATVGDVGTACVFLPEGDKRFGEHCYPADTPGRCWCHQLYGEQKKWGCLWFKAWLDNVQKAVDLEQKLVIVHFPYENNQGLVDWEQLPATGERLWNRQGLGGSQKGEAAYLRKKFPERLQHVDLIGLRDLVPGFNGIPASLLSGADPEIGDRVVITLGRNKGKYGTWAHVKAHHGYTGPGVILDSGEQVEGTFAGVTPVQQWASSEDVQRGRCNCLR